MGCGDYSGSYPCNGCGKDKVKISVYLCAECLETLHLMIRDYKKSKNSKKVNK